MTTNPNTIIEKKVNEELILIILDAAGYGKEQGGLTTEEVTKLVNRIRKQLSLVQSTERAQMVEDWEDLHKHVASALAWSDKHDKDEMLSAILNHIIKLGKKYGAFKSILVKPFLPPTSKEEAK